MSKTITAIACGMILSFVVGLNLPASAASGLFLKTPAATNTYVVNFSNDNNDSKATAYALQGLVNRASAEVYIDSRPSDMAHLNDCGKPYSALSPVGGSYSGLLTLFQQYQSSVSNMFIYNPANDWTFYLAVMAGAQSNGIPVTATIAAALQAQFPGWAGTVVDYSNIGTNRVQGYDWALTNLMPNCNRKSLFIATTPYMNVIDYVVSSKSFIFNLTLSDVTQSNECVKIFATPGYGPGTSLGGYSGDSINITANPYGIGYAVSDWYSNGSFWSSFPNKTYTQRAGSAVTAQNGKVYVSIILSDGDNLQIDQELLYGIWQDPARGSVPVGTGLSPLLQEINSPLLDYFYANKTASDELIAGPNGFQFTYLNYYKSTLLPQWCALNATWCADAGFHTASVWWGTYPNANYSNYTASCGLECVRHHYNGIANPQFTNGVVILNEGISDCTTATQLYNDLAGVNINASAPVFTTDKLIAQSFNNTNFSAIKSVIEQLNANFPGKYVFQLPSDQAETAWIYYAAGTPTLSLPSGSYVGTQSVTITSATAGATIYYTTNGSTPTTSSPSGANGLTILVAPPVNATIKAFARLNGKVNSRIASGSYTVVASPATWTNAAGGSWATAANWSNNIIANGIGTTADFSTLTLASNLTVTLDGARTNGNLLFDDQNVTDHVWTLATGTGGPLTLATIVGTPFVSNNVAVNFNVAVAGTQGLQKAGAGTLSFTNANTYTGATTISGGTLAIGGGGRLGDGTYASAITNNGTFAYNSSASQTLSGIISGTGALNILGTGTLTLSGANTYTGDTTVSNGTLVVSGTGCLYSQSTPVLAVALSVGSGAQITITSTANNAIGQGTNETWTVAGAINSIGGAAHTLPSTVTLNNGTLTGVANAAYGTFYNSSANAATITANGANNTISAVNVGTSATLTLNTPLATDALTVSSAIGIAARLAGSLTKMGLGTVTLTGANLYNDDTTISAGTLALSGGGSIANTPGITLAGNAIFDVSGLSSAFTLGSTQTLGNSAPGAIINGTNNCSAGALSLVYDGVNPCFIQTNGGMTLLAGTVVTVNNVGAPLDSGSYTLIAATATGAPGKVYGTTPSSVTVIGNGALATASLAIDGAGNLNLVIGAPQAWTGASDANWTTPGNWTTGVSPGAGVNALFNSSSTANLATVLNENYNLGTLWLTTPTGPVSMDASGGANTLAISNGINMAFASQNLTITAPVVLGAGQTWTVTNAQTLSVNGGVSGSAALTVGGGGTVSLGGTNTVSSITVANSAVINESASGVIAGPGVTFTHSSTGTSILAGKNTYTGATTVSAGILNLPGQINNSSITVSNNAVINELASGLITGAGVTFTHNSTGTSTLAGRNTYTGATTISAGALTISGAGQLGNGIYAANITNNAVFNYNSSANQTISGAITGTGALNYQGTGTLTLSGANTYAGNTTVTNGTLELKNPGVVNSSSSGITVSPSGTLKVNHNGANWIYVNPSITLNGSTLTNNSSGNFYVLLNGGAVTVNAASTIGTYAPAFGTYAGTIFLEGGLKGSAPVTIQAGANGVGVSLRTANSTYGGPMTVNGTASATAGIGSGLAVVGPNVSLPNATITLNGTMEMGHPSTGMGYAQPASGDGNGKTFAMDALNGPGVVVANFTSASTRTLSVGNNNGSGTFSGIIAAGTSSTLSLIKNGTGTQTLSGASTYSGTTTIRAGTLALSGSGSIAGTASIAVASNAIFKVSGLTSAFTLGSSQTMGNSAPGAIINGTNNCSTGTLALVYDGVNPCFIKTNGGMRLSASTLITVNNTGATLGALTTNVIVAATATGTAGRVYGTMPLVTVTGGGAIGPASLQIDASGNLNLVIGTPSPQAWTGTISTSWSTAGNWLTGIIPGAGSDAVFNNSSTANPATVLNASFNLGTLILNTPAGPVSIDGSSGANSLTISNGIDMSGASQNLTITAPVVLGSSQSWTVTNARTLTVKGAVSGGGSTLTVAGGGAVSLGGTNIYTGGTTVNSGTLTLSSGGRLGNGSYAGAIYIANGAILTYANPAQSQTLSGTITGAGTLTQNGGGDLILTGSGGNTINNLSVTGGRVFINNAKAIASSTTTTIGANGILDLGNAPTTIGAITVQNNGGLATRVSAGTTLSSVTLPGSGTVIFNNDDSRTYPLTISSSQTLTGNLTVHIGGSRTTANAVGGVTFSGDLGGSGGLIVKVNTNTLALSGANTYTGNTTAIEGTLAIAQPTLAPSSTVSIASGAVLRLNFSTTNVVGALVLNGVLKPAGVYNSANSGGYISGTGSLKVAPNGPTLTSVTPNPLTGSSYPVTLGLIGSGFTGASAVLLTNLTAASGTSYSPTINSDANISVSFVPGTANSSWNATVVNGTPSAQVGFTVAAPTAVSISQANLASAGAGNVVLSGTGGAPGNRYAVVSATNLAPPAGWSPIVTNAFDGSGNFSYTNTVNTGTPQLFLRIAQ